jgi:hypothetical protein
MDSGIWQGCRGLLLLIPYRCGGSQTAAQRAFQAGDITIVATSPDFFRQTRRFHNRVHARHGLGGQGKGNGIGPQVAPGIYSFTEPSFQLGANVLFNGFRCIDFTHDIGTNERLIFGRIFGGYIRNRGKMVDAK